MPLHDFECPEGHQFEKIVKWDQMAAKCPECGKRAQQVWLARRSVHRQLSDPIVVHRLADGSYSFPGRSDVPTPKGAERIEMRTMGEYQREFRRINQDFASKASRHDEELHRRHEAILSHARSDLRQMMAQSDDPLVKDLCRHALESYNSDRPDRSGGAIWSEAMERDASNREAWHQPGETSIRGRK